MTLFILFLTCFGIFTTSLAMKSALKFPVCKQSDKTVENCLQSTIQDAITKLKEGIAEIGAVSIDPLIVPKLTFQPKGTGIVDVEQTLKNAKIYNLSTLKINKLKFTKKDNFIVDLELHAPEITFEADYEISGRILLLPINGSGHSKSLQENYTVTAHIEFETENNNGKMYFKIKELKLELNPEKIIFTFENLFDGNEQLGQEMNRIINRNWRDVFEDMKEEHEELLSKALTVYINKIFKKTEAQYLFPE